MFRQCICMAFRHISVCPDSSDASLLKTLSRPRILSFQRLASIARNIYSARRFDKGILAISAAASAYRVNYVALVKTNALTFYLKRLKYHNYFSICSHATVEIMKDS